MTDQSRELLADFRRALLGVKPELYDSRGPLFQPENRELLVKMLTPKQ